MMKAWWKETGWPWLKENWWVVLVAPLALIVFVLIFLKEKVVPTAIIDPTREADSRAFEEERLRVEQLELINERLRAEKTQVEQEYAALEDQFEERLREEVDGLRDDPERLRQLMLGVQK